MVRVRQRSILFHGKWLRVWLGVKEISKEHDQKVGKQEIWEEVCGWISPKQYRMFYSPCEYSPKKSQSSEEYLLGGKNDLFSGCQSAPFSRHPILSSELVTNGHGGRDEGYAWAQQYGLLLTRVDLSIAMLCVQHVNRRPTESLICYHFLGEPGSHLVTS